MNILITAIGSMSSEAVIKSLRLDSKNFIVGCDIHQEEWIAPAQLVDVFYMIPKATENKKYITSLQTICIKEKINYIIPLTDPEIDIISKNRIFFSNNQIELCISNQKCVEICRNKQKLFNFFKKDKNVRVIPTSSYKKLLSKDIKFPIIAKPIYGRSSEGIFKIYSRLDLEYFIKKYKYKDYIIQPLLIGDIYTVDFIRNKTSNSSFSVVRKELIRTFNGAGLVVQLINSQEINELSKFIGEEIDINGCVNFEFINSDGTYYLMDINPRFSAGIAFSNLTGYDFIKNHIKCFTLSDIECPIKYNESIVSKRFQEFILN